jgi:hypothetical protein
LCTAVVGSRVPVVHCAYTTRAASATLASRTA